MSTYVIHHNNVELGYCCCLLSFILSKLCKAFKIVVVYINKNVVEKYSINAQLWTDFWLEVRKVEQLCERTIWLFYRNWRQSSPKLCRNRQVVLIHKSDFIFEVLFKADSECLIEEISDDEVGWFTWNFSKWTLTEFSELPFNLFWMSLMRTDTDNNRSQHQTLDSKMGILRNIHQFLPRFDQSIVDHHWAGKGFRELLRVNERYCSMDDFL
jgi:ABC-type nickel/cobalt efflux system permease component RcnA